MQRLVGHRPQSLGGTDGDANLDHELCADAQRI
jgi:hypothetical protein